MILIKPKFEIITYINALEILKGIESIGRICYKSEDKITEDSYKKFVKGLIARGHESVIEHISLTVKFICDRGVSHEIVRHRIASYSQESTRYCNYEDTGVFFIIPSWVHGLDEFIEDTSKKINFTEEESIWFQAMERAEESYLKLIDKGWTPQQARCVLPNSLKTEIYMTANLREWRHFFKLRTSIQSHPQLRELTNPLLEKIKEKLPIIFDDIYPL